MEGAYEFELVTRCCRLAFAEGEVERRSESRPDWDRFLRHVRFHRVQGLVWPVLAGSEMPEDVAHALSRDARSIAAHNLRAAADSRVLQDTFRKAGVEPLFVKGLTLAVLAYGDIGKKAAVDIDVVVPDADLERSAELLKQQGYHPAEPPGPYRPDSLGAWHGPRKESTWIREEPWSVVDLHTRLSDNPRLIPSIGPQSPRRLVEVSSGISLPTLPPDDLFAYLCVHGASSAWFRLKWITDLAALLHRCGPAEIERLHERSQALGAGRSADQALLLADELYGTLAANADLKERLLADPRSRWLFRAAWKQLAGRTEPLEPTSRPWGTARIHLTQFFLLPSARFKFSELLRQARTALR